MAAYDRLMMLSDDKRSFTGVARETISGGFIVCASGADDVVHASGNTGGPTSFAYTDIGLSTVVTDTDTKAAVGLAITTATSGLELGVVSDGIFILEAGSAGVTTGYPIHPTAYNSFVDVTTGSVATREQPVGRALTGASAEQTYFVGRLHF